MKKIIYVLTLLFCITSIAQSREVLVNKNSNTRGITKMKFYTNSQYRTYIQIYASCNPEDCYWGKFSVIKDNTYGEKIRRGINPAQYYQTIIIKKSFVIRNVIISKYQGVDSYKVTVISDYKDPKRKDKTKSEVMIKL